MAKRKDLHKHELKRDGYSRRRGGTSEFLNISCVRCNTWVLLYQKDGPGSLLRLYLDRIFEPPRLAELQNTCSSVSDVPNLFCPSCNTLIGVPMLYEPENRLAFRLIQNAFFKRKSDGARGVPATSTS